MAFAGRGYALAQRGKKRKEAGVEKAPRMLKRLEAHPVYSAEEAGSGVPGNRTQGGPLYWCVLDDRACPSVLVKQQRAQGKDGEEAQENR